MFLPSILSDRSHNVDSMPDSRLEKKELFIQKETQKPLMVSRILI